MNTGGLKKEDSMGQLGRIKSLIRYVPRQIY